MNLAKFLLEYKGDYIWSEEIRSRLGVSNDAVKLVISDYVKSGKLEEWVAVICPNKHCGRVITYVKDKLDVPDVTNCDLCEMAEEDIYSFDDQEVVKQKVYKIIK